jgi:glycerate 2-kinase
MRVKNHEELVLNGATPILQQKRQDILEILSSALDAVHPAHIIPNVLKDSQLCFPTETIDLATFDHVYLVGFGKASAGMAQAVCDATKIKKGVVITNDSQASLTHQSIEIFIGGHPLPTEGSIHGAEKILSLLHECSENDCVLVLISGGGSSLFCKPRVPLVDLQQTIDLLIRSGAIIQEINTIRKHLSFVKGGQLAAQTKATIFSLIISDVIHDPLTAIASGPTAPDPTTYEAAEEILQRYQLWNEVSSNVRSIIRDGRKGRIPETPKQDDEAFQKVFNLIIANNELACRAAVSKAAELGYDARLVTTAAAGEARTLGKYLIDRIHNSLMKDHAAFVSGGEPTVTVRGHGIGGRNQEMVLGCVQDIANSDMVVASFATDGIDGNSTAAGAIADGYSWNRAQKKHLLPDRFLEENDSNAFFHALGDTIHTGATGTNVMDIQIILP